MPTATETHPATQSQVQQRDVQSPEAVNTTQLTEQPMSSNSIHTVIDESTPMTTNNLIVRDGSGLNVSLSLENVRSAASTWYTNSTRELYKVLGHCYELYFAVESANHAQRDKYRDAIEAEYKNLGGEQKANKTETRIVSLVFNFADIDRRQRSRYASVLKSGYNSVPQPANASAFTRWLEENGGIAAVISSLSKNKPEVSKSEITAYLNEVPTKAQLSLPNKGNRFVVLLAKSLDTQTLEVVHQFDDEGLTDDIAKRAYKAHKKLDKDECQPTAANVADDLAEPAAVKEAA